MPLLPTRTTRPGTPRARTIALAAALVGLADIGLLATAPTPAVPVVGPEAPVTADGLPARAVAGDPLLLAVDGGRPGRMLELVVAGSLGSAVVVATTGPDGRAAVAVPAHLARGRGLLTVAHAGRELAAVVVDAAAIDPVVRPYVGPRTIVADGADHTMLVTVPTDVHGNPAAPGTPVDLAVRRPDGTATVEALRTDGLLAWRRVGAGTHAGRTQIRVGLDGANGPVGEVVEVAGPPAVVVLTAPTTVGLADGRMLLRVETERLVDVHGNEVADGVEVVLEVRGPEGVGHLTAVVTAGRAALDVRAGELPGPVEVVAEVAGVRSAPLVLVLEPALEALPVTRGRGAREDVVTVGPVVDVHGAWVPDGTAVVASWGTLVTTTQVVDGMATAVLAHGGAHPDGPVLVRVAGTTVEVAP